MSEGFRDTDGVWYANAHEWMVEVERRALEKHPKRFARGFDRRARAAGSDSSPDTSTSNDRKEIPNG